MKKKKQKRYQYVVLSKREHELKIENLKNDHYPAISTYMFPIRTYTQANYGQKNYQNTKHYPHFKRLFFSFFFAMKVG